MSVLGKINNRITAFRNNSRFRNFGERSKIIKPMRIVGKKFMSIGSHVSIRNGARLECISIWNGEKYNPELIIENSVSIQQNSHITCANRIIIGEGTSLLPDVLITDIEHLYSPVTSISNTGIIAGSVNIGKFCTIGAGTRILAGGVRALILVMVVLLAQMLLWFLIFQAFLWRWAFRHG